MGDMDAIRAQRLAGMLGEIEARLAGHPDVVRAVVAERGERLVGYVTVGPHGAPDEDALREHLKAALPAYKIPRHFMVLDALPMTADGEIDRDALPDPQAALSSAALPASSPGDHPEDARVGYLAGIWSQLLDRPAGPQDNFFDLGGHSMLAVQMANRVHRDTGVRIQLMTLATQTLAQIAAELPSTARAAPAGLSARIVGNLRGMLGGARSGKQA